MCNELPSYIYEMAYNAGYAGDDSEISLYLTYPTSAEVEAWMWGYSDGVNAVFEDSLHDDYRRTSR